MNQGIALHDIIWDESGKPVDYRYIRVNNFYEEMTGLKSENIIGKRVSEVLPLTEKYWWDAFAEVSLTRKPKRVINYSNELKKYYSISFYSPQPNRVAGIVDDITGLKDLEEEIRESELRYHLLAEKSRTVLWEIDLSGLFTYISPVVESVLEYKQEEVIFIKHFSDLFPCEFKSEYSSIMNQFIDRGESNIHIERPLLSKSGNLIWVDSFISAQRNSLGAIILYKGSDIDISERKAKEEQIVYLNTHDHLTHLFNRRYFDQLLEDLDKVENYPISIIMGDLNGLKLVNDAFGHAIGDEMLKGVSNILSHYFDKLGYVSRIGGDEFVVLLLHTSLEEADRHANNVKNIIETENISGVNYSISFGTACNESNKSLLEIIKIAEDNMYSRKLYEMTSHRSDTIKTILKTLHEKNPREEMHSNRVSIICQEIGKKLHMNSDELNLLKTISHLHDIGKIAIDESILNKPGKLNAREWEEIKKHPEIGFRILSTSHEYSEIALDILSHHERYDGTGYPRGMKGEDIPLRARIISVADSYDAMVSFRTYKDPLSPEQAIEELKRCSGTQFDPTIVETFMKIHPLIMIDFESTK
jgi:diguanylate cyclase (GGDEF)-like protein/PAS domain S-box-containing protein